MAHATYDFPSPGKPFKKVKAVELRLCNSEGVECGHQVGVYLKSAGTPSFCITLPTDYYDTWVSHPNDGVTTYRAEKMRSNIDFEARIIRAPSFEEATQTLQTLSAHWREHYANRTMEKCIFITLELKSAKHSINPPSFSSSGTLVGMTIRWGYRVAGREYEHRDHIEDPLSASPPPFSELVRYQGRSSGNGIVLPFTAELWGELSKIRDTLERAADRLAMLAEEKTAIALLTALSSGTPLLAAA